MRKRVLALLVVSLVPGLVLADVTYEEETKMGGLMNVMGLGKAMKSVTRVSGDFMRTDDGNNATIIDLAGEKILTLDVKKKTYSVMTFEEMKKKMEEAVAAMQGKKAEPAKEGEKPSDVTASAEARVTDTGRTETIQGLSCKQYLLELDMTLASEKEQQSGTMSTVTEMWMSKDVPGSEEMNAFYKKMAEKMGTMTLARQFASPDASGQNQPFGANMQKMADEMKKMEGHSMRSVIYFGSAEAAKQEALGQKKPDEGGGGGGLGGLLKKMQPVGNDESKEKPEGGQASQGGVMMKMTTETKKIDTNPIDPKVFAVPTDYKLVESK